uniref:Uncharacterized protein n=1 Tax=Trypanosoma vivax (strain Y486) TaxID=1055687 RepID=G0U647_TRYVY|nr:hypothetical protein, unlikely [Trypanosoma vivax Y486]
MHTPTTTPSISVRHVISYMLHICNHPHNVAKTFPPPSMLLSFFPFTPQFFFLFFFPFCFSFSLFALHFICYGSRLPMLIIYKHVCICMYVYTKIDRYASPSFFPSLLFLVFLFSLRFLVVVFFFHPFFLSLLRTSLSFFFLFFNSPSPFQCRLFFFCLFFLSLSLFFLSTLFPHPPPSPFRGFAPLLCSSRTRHFDLDVQLGLPSSSSFPFIPFRRRRRHCLLSHLLLLPMSSQTHPSHMSLPPFPFSTTLPHFQCPFGLFLLSPDTPPLLPSSFVCLCFLHIFPCSHTTQKRSLIRCSATYKKMERWGWGEPGKI